MLRIDVDGGDPYGIPADNPFAGGGGAREIFAWGLCNPWRFSFDRNTGALWAGDVGQNQWEEVSIVELGGNYGWSDKEGSHCYDTTPCTTGPWIDPVTEYDHSQGNSITGGYVYRGQNIPTLFGSYVYGDYSSGRIWSFRIDPMTGLPVVELLVNSNLSIVSFAEDHQGELYVLSIDGRMRKLVDGSTASPTETIPRQLSQTGCVDPEDPTKPSPGLIPYKPIAEFWSDGAEKTRYIALPDGEKVDIEDDGDFGFPIGTVLVKHFTLSGRRIETRLFMRHADGEWGGYTYRWSENEDEATLLDGSAQAQVGEATWNFPSRGECMSCHTLEAGRSLGLEIAQLNSDLDYESTGRRANQLATLDHIGIFSGELAAAPANLDKLTDPQRGSVLDERARSYLHTNCAGCHRSDRAGRVSMDLRFATELGELSACETDPATGDLGVAGAKLLRPGAPEESLIWLRMNRMDAHRMPPLGGNTIDAEGLGLIEAWILDIAECP
jgi:uncharacterized repeat protein (TIGR03806 family)